MGDFFSIANLMILALAVAIFLRLRSVLGRRTGNERQPYDPYAASSPADGGGKGGGDNVVSLPRHGSGEGGAATPADVEARLKGIAEEGTPLYDSLAEIIRADPSFSPKTFVEGASMAYEMIVTAFANGDRASLRPLLSPEVLEGFDSAIAAREEAGQTMTTTLIGIEKIRIAKAALRGDAAHMTVRIDSQMITATYDRAGELVSGDPNKVVDVLDVWTFERPVSSRDPNWTLVATETA